MTRAKTLRLAVIVAAILVLGGRDASAAALTESVWHIIGSQNAPTADTGYDVSVHPAYGGYRGQGNVGGGTVVVNESFGATILDYGFFKANSGLPGLIEAYASGTNGLISLPTTTAQGGNESHADVWTTNDPGGYTFPNPANFTSATVLKMQTCTGTLNISSLTEGRVYFFYGGYRGWTRFDLTMSGAIATNVVLPNVGRNDAAQENEMYVVGVDFSHTGEYDTIEYTFVNEEGSVGRGRYAGIVLVTPPTDTSAPNPSPMAWEVAPAADSESSVIMTATNAVDPEGAPVWYLFKNLTLGTDSGWQLERTWVDTGLSAGSNYTYTVEARDHSPNRNATLPSGAASVATLTADTNAPPTPSFVNPPTPLFPNEPYQISMTASVVTDPEDNGVEYYFICTSGGGNDSGWQDSTNYVDTGLTPETTYEYTVKARDKSIAQNESAPSPPLSTTTLKVPTATLIDPGPGSHFIFGGDDFDVSVYPENNGFRCAGKGISEVFNGTIQDYAFINESPTPNVVQVYASSGSELISFDSYEPRGGGNINSGNDMNNLWTATDPGTPDWTTTADHTSALNVGAFNFVQGSIDVSAFASGSLYYFYGGWRSYLHYDAVIEDTDGVETALPLYDFGSEDRPNSGEWYCKRIDFTNPAGYDKIEWYYTSDLYSGYPHCSIAGIVLVAEDATIPGTVLMVR